MNFIKRSVFVAFSAAVFCLPYKLAVACDYCTISPSGDSVPAGPQGISLGVSEDIIGYTKIRNDGEETLIGKGQYLKSNVTLLSGRYEIPDSVVRVGADIPFIYNLIKRPKAGSSDLHSENDSGIGDIILKADYAPILDRTEKAEFTWRVGVGVKLPTGDTSELKSETEIEDPLNLVRGRDLTLGSGSVDLPFGTEIAGRYERVRFEGGVQYILRTEGDYNYQYANDLRWRAGVGADLFRQGDVTAGPVMSLIGLHRDRDSLDGEDVENSGMDLIGLQPELRINSGKNLMIRVAVFTPINEDVNGLQIVQDHTIRLGVTYGF